MKKFIEQSQNEVERSVIVKAESRIFIELLEFK